MANILELYGKAREDRKKHRLEIDLKYHEDILVIQNEELNEWLEICKKINDGEIINYDLKIATINLGEAVNQRDQLLEQIKDLKIELGLEEEEYI